MDLPDGVYERIISKAIENALAEHKYKSKNISKSEILFDDSSDILSRYMQKVIKSGLDILKTNAKKCDSSKNPTEKEKHAIKAEIDVCNEIIEYLAQTSEDEDISEWKIGENGEKLLSIWNKKYNEYSRPKSSLSISSLFTGGVREITLSDELCREVSSSDEVCFLVSFIKISGIRLIFDSLEKFTHSGGCVKILTTTYMGATDPLAIERLSSLPNTEIKISYNTRSTRLHAKSYYFKRKTGYSTVFIGSSNLSSAAISDGMEWNIKITNQDAPQIIAMVDATFESYWNSDDFEPDLCSCSL